MPMTPIMIPDLIVPPAPMPDLEQIKFFLRIMQEHALFIQLGLPCSETQLISQAIQFQNIFRQLSMEAQSITPEELPAFIETIIPNVESFFQFKRHLLHLAITCGYKPGNWNTPLLLDHISREAEYFLLLLRKIQTGEEMPEINSIVQENVFWTRIMADHAKFIRSLIDPSERRIVKTADDFSEEFDALNLQARDFEDFLWNFHSVPSLPRFETELIGSTRRIRDFKAEAARLIQDCQALGVAPALLLDHVRREADHFLQILEMIQGQLGQTSRVR